MKFIKIFDRSFSVKPFPLPPTFNPNSLQAGPKQPYRTFLQCIPGSRQKSSNQTIINNKSLHSRNMSTVHSVFVYGTLKKGEPNHHWLQAKENGHAKFISKGKTITKYPLIIASKYNIPFLLQSPGKGENVIGEVYEVDEKMLSHLDILEDHPTFYVREIDQIEIMASSEEKAENNLIDCWIYFLKKFKPSLLEEEYYVEYQSEGSHSKPYTPWEQRIPGYHAKADVLMT